MPVTIPRARVRFGPYEFDAATSELRKHGLHVRLQGKPLQVLQALVESPGQVITRDDLQRRLWPADTFVDFENGLNTAIRRLRTALNDSAESPRYVETVARTGYRFLAPVEVIGTEPDHAVDRPAPVASDDNRRWIAPVGLALSICCAAWLLWNTPSRAPTTQIRQITFRRGTISGARFGPDGQTILYSARWDRGARQLYLHNGVSPESRQLGLADWNLVSVSSQGELLLLQAPGTLPIGGGDLAKAPMNGGVPLVVERNVMTADWSADGKAFALSRAVDGMFALEYPAGRVLHRTSGWISSVRVSPRGDAVAFVEHPIRHDDSGTLRMITPGTQAVNLAGPYSNIDGVEWHPITGEVWFTAAAAAAPKSLWAVRPGRPARPVIGMAGAISLADISGSGRVLVSRDSRRLEVAGRLADDDTEREYSWLDWSRAQDISPDGSRFLFDESGEAVHNVPTSYLHSRTTNATLRLGEAAAMGFTPDGEQVLLLPNTDRTQFRLAPLGGGPWQDVPRAGLEYQWGKYFPDGRRLLVLASEAGGPLRLYRQDLSSGARPVAIAPPGTVRYAAISPGGDAVAALMPSGQLTLFPAQPGGAEPRVISAAEPLGPIRYSRDGRTLYVHHQRAYTQVPARVSRLEIATGRLKGWKQLGPVDPIGVNLMTRILIADDEQHWLFTYRRSLSELFVIEGL